LRFVQPSAKLLKKLKKFKSDKSIIEGYHRILEELETSPDPTEIGERKTVCMPIVMQYTSQKVIVLFTCIYQKKTQLY
ncbi:MAG: hypothetical protein KGH89_09780, partial [Thaumarchaeota archaeon]|nr:hypothetical protein [Nitrososphaerota archaeon]